MFPHLAYQSANAFSKARRLAVFRILTRFLFVGVAGMRGELKESGETTMRSWNCDGTPLGALYSGEIWESSLSQAGQQDLLPFLNFFGNFKRILRHSVNIFETLFFSNKHQNHCFSHELITHSALGLIFLKLSFKSWAFKKTFLCIQHSTS